MRISASRAAHPRAGLPARLPLHSLSHVANVVPPSGHCFKRIRLQASRGELMTRASIQLTAMALALFLAGPLGLRADDPNPFGGSSPFGKALDDQKIREDFAKLRQQLEQSQGDVLKPNKGAKFHRWTKSGTKSSVPKQSTLQ